MITLIPLWVDIVRYILSIGHTLYTATQEVIHWDIISEDVQSWITRHGCWPKSAAGTQKPKQMADGLHGGLDSGQPVRYRIMDGALLFPLEFS